MGKTMAEYTLIGSLGRAREEILEAMDEIELNLDMADEYTTLADILDCIEKAIDEVTA